MHQSAFPTDQAAPYLAHWAAQGYLLVSVADDVLAHGDAQFRLTRKLGRLLPTREFWEQNAAFHDWLCGQRQPHLPVRLGLDPDGPAALAWLIPAPAAGVVSAHGFSATLPLGDELRERWLLTWARRICLVLPVAQRMLLQLPGAGKPAHWYYPNYIGEVPFPGLPLEQVTSFLAGLPRYPTGTAGLPEPAAPGKTGEWPLLINAQPTRWKNKDTSSWPVPIVVGTGRFRREDHLELSPYWEAHY